MENLSLEKNNVATVKLTTLSDSELVRLSKEKLLSLSLEEMHAVQDYFQRQNREPTDVELETIAQTWSEHCKHKTLRGDIDYVSSDATDVCPSRHYKNLLKETVVAATQKLNKPYTLSVFTDNAGIIAFDEEDGVAFKAETHNHPSALEPYGGAGTGIGGVIRDILGVGLGAKPVLNTDVFCVGEYGIKRKENSGILPPERVLPGVVAGVRDYGNRMGIPTSNGAILFDDGFYANPLVFCGTVGIIPKDKIEKQICPGDLIVSLGGRTGRDGIHGATFSSAALEAGISASVVQIGNAIVEKKAADVLLRARDLNLFRAVTDCGAGGFSSAVGEIGSECGVRVDLEKAPLKYDGLAPWEIWVSESQERMILAVPKDKWKAFAQLCALENAECAVIGELTDTGRLELFYRGEKVGDLENKFLHEGIPQIRAQARWNVSSKQSESAPKLKASGVKKVWKDLLAHPNIASKLWVVQQYDHEVQGTSVVKPFVGLAQNGPSDAAVIRPKLTSPRGVVVSAGINPWMGTVDPYWMTANAIDEALRNLVAVGGDISTAAILDNFCWGDTRSPEGLAGLVRAAQACYDFSLAYGVPFISGKDSLNNTWLEDSGRLRSIPGTLLISAIGVIPDIGKTITMDWKSAGNALYLLGETRAEFGGSHFNKVRGLSAGEVPHVCGKQAAAIMHLLTEAISNGWVASCHDLSEGGLAVAAAEMAMASGLGAKLHVQNDWATELFSESASRWVLEVPQKFEARMKRHFANMPLQHLGEVQGKPQVEWRGTDKTTVALSVEEITRLWNRFSKAQSA